MRSIRRLVLVVLVAAASNAEAAPPFFTVLSPVPADARTRIETVARDAFVATRVEAPTYSMRPEMFEYLLDHPDFASQVTRALGLARYRIWQEGDELWLDDGWGTRGTFTVVHAARGLRAYYARGAFQQKYLPEMRGEAAAVLEYDFQAGAGGRTLVTSRATGYLQVDNQFLRMLGRVAAPFVQAKADKEAAKLLRVFARASQAIEERPAEVYQKLSERPDVPPRDLAEFRALLHLR